MNPILQTPCGGILPVARRFLSPAAFVCLCVRVLTKFTFCLFSSLCAAGIIIAYVGAARLFTSGMAEHAPSTTGAMKYERLFLRPAGAGRTGVSFAGKPACGRAVRCAGRQRAVIDMVPARQRKRHPFLYGLVLVALCGAAAYFGTVYANSRTMPEQQNVVVYQAPSGNASVTGGARLDAASVAAAASDSVVGDHNGIRADRQLFQPICCHRRRQRCDHLCRWLYRHKRPRYQRCKQHCGAPA